MNALCRIDPPWAITQKILPGSMLVKKQVRNKDEPLVEEAESIEFNPSYTHVRVSNGRETTVSIRDVAPRVQNDALNQISKIKSLVTILILLMRLYATILVLLSPQLTRMQMLTIIFHLKLSIMLYHLKIFPGVLHVLANLIYDTELCLMSDILYIYLLHVICAFFRGGDCGNLHTISQSVLQLVRAAQLACTCVDTLRCFPCTLFM